MRKEKTEVHTEE